MSYSDDNYEIREKLLELNIHETLIVGFFTIMRVIGGWLYIDKSSQICTFVPED